MIRTVTYALFAATLALLATTAVWAAKDEKKASVDQDSRLNQPAPTFELPGTDGKNHKLTDYKGKTVVLVWEGTKCPWDRAYQPILSKLASENSGVVFLGINSNKSEPMEEVKEVQNKENIPYVILKDANAKVAGDYGAQTTPHIFIIDANGKLVYIGGIEKAPSGVDSVGKSSEQYLAPNLAAIKEGKPLPHTKTVPKGCSIKR
jgi:peroxiredoxin